MESCKYLLIGGGRATDAAVRGIREVDQAGSILVVSDEDDPPYDRPPLSKSLWRGNAVETVWRHTELAGAELRLGTRIVAIDRDAKATIDAKGSAVGYERLLLATGGTPRRLRGVQLINDLLSQALGFQARLGSSRPRRRIRGDRRRLHRIGDRGVPCNERAQGVLDFPRTIHLRPRIPTTTGEFFEFIFSKTWG